MLQFVQRGGDNRQTLGQLPQWLSMILRSRGVDTEEKARLFLKPELSQLHDPMVMQGMDQAVRLIRDAVLEQTPIMVYGDYDADGVCATAVMMETLTALGARVRYRIPSRHGEGYGLNADAVREMAKEAKLLITVDCGVTNHEEVRLAQLLGMTVMVADHHQMAQTPSPADVVLNPLLGSYPFRRLCGAGVALKLTQALLGMEGVLRVIDLAALATVADIVPLIDENRVIVTYGLRRISEDTRPGLRALMLLAGVNPPVSSTQVAFRLAPRINAGGRLEHASQCVELLLSRDTAEAERLASHLEGQNEARQAMQTDITRQAEEMIAQTVDFREDLVIIVMGEGWNSGVIGLAAGRICERYHFPTIVLSRQGDLAVGSCRSIPGVNIHAMLTVCADLFERFGGHEQAAGLTMRADLVPELRRRLNLAIRSRCELTSYIPRREYDAALNLAQVDLPLIEQLEALQPTGFGNPAPVFLARGVQVQQALRVGRDRQHLKLSLLEGNALRDGIAFGMGAMAEEGLDTVDFLFTPEKNEFRGRITAQLRVDAMRHAEGSLHIPGDETLFRGLLQEMTLLAENINQIPVLPQSVTASAVTRLMQQGRGVLLLTHTRERAAEAAAYGMCDTALRRVTDVRGFNTLLYAPALEEVRDLWQHMVLLDGDVLPGECAMLSRQCPHARLYAMKPAPTLTGLLETLAMDDDTLRRLYAYLRVHASQPLHMLAEGAGLSAEQTAAGLVAFEQVGLVRFGWEPFAVVMLPPVRCRMDDSALIRYLRAVRDAMADR